MATSGRHMARFSARNWSPKSASTEIAPVNPHHQASLRVLGRPRRFETWPVGVVDADALTPPRPVSILLVASNRPFSSLSRQRAVE